jgi:hypothetical protein
MVDAAIRVILPLLALTSCGTSNSPRALCEQRYSRLSPSIGFSKRNFLAVRSTFGRRWRTYLYSV